MVKMKGVVMRGTFALLAAVASAACGAANKRIVSAAWEWASTGPGELLELQPQIAAAGVDGIIVTLRFAHGGEFYGGRDQMQEPRWDWGEIEPEVAKYRACTSLPGLRECFVSGYRVPKKRFAWTDDESWAVAADHTRMLGRFAREAGFAGICIDHEDYPRQRQFVRIEGDPPLAELLPLVRRRGAELVRGAFAEFPRAKLLFFWFFSEMSRTYCGAANGLAAASESGELLPQFLNGILDALPPEALVIDGNENSYEFKSADFEYFLNIRQQRDGLAGLVAPENRWKYERQVSFGSAIYTEQYVATDSSKQFYKGPWAGSRLGMYRRDLKQALASSEGYVWFWGERTPLVRRPKRDKSEVERYIDPIWWNKTLDELMPGFNEATRALHRPRAFLAKDLPRFLAAERPKNLAAGLLTDSSSGTWQEKPKGREPGTFKMHGDALLASGVGKGCALLRIEDVKAGELYAVRIEAKPQGGGFSAHVGSRRDGAWRFFVPVQALEFGAADGDGWRRGAALVAVPEGVDTMALLCNVRQAEGESCLWRNAEIYKIEAIAKPTANLVGSRVPRDRGRAGRASLPGFATASIEKCEK